MGVVDAEEAELDGLDPLAIIRPLRDKEGDESGEEDDREAVDDDAEWTCCC